MYSSFPLTMAIFLFLTLISVTGTSSVTKRDVMNSIRNLLPSSPRQQPSCSVAVGDALISCRNELNFQARDIPISEKNQDSRCCRFAHLRKCMKDYVSGTCGSATSGVVDELLYNGFQDWMADCVNYDYYAPVCLFHLWYTWITLVTVVVVIIGCCCLVCCIRCFCCC